MRRAVGLAVLTALAASATPTLAQFPGASWPTATPAQVRMNGAVLDSIDQEIASGRYGNVDRFLVIRGGRAVIDKRYVHDYDRIYGDSARARGALVLRPCKGRVPRRRSRFAKLRGRATVRMKTEEILALTRG